MNQDKIVKLTFVGDLLCYNQYIEACKLPDNQGYDFRPTVYEIKKYFQDSDYVVGNLETPLDDVDWKRFQLAQEGFNAPPQFLEAFIDAGVDLFLTGNNHSYDQGENGLLTTLNTLDAYRVEHIGTYRTQDEAKQIFIKEINGIKIAFLNYTFGINYNVHGNILPKEKDYQINLLAPPEYHELEDWWNLLPSLLHMRFPKKLQHRLLHTYESYSYSKQTEKIISDITRAKEMGADSIVLLPHFGIECTTRPLRFTRKWVEKMFSAGADVIIGGHTHSLQPMEFWNLDKMSGKYHSNSKELAHTDKKGFVIYSMGNFISQGVDYCPKKLSTISVILNVNIRKDATGKTSVNSVSCIPTWIEYRGADKPVHVVAIPDKIVEAKENGDIELEKRLLSMKKRIHTIITDSHNQDDAVFSENEMFSENQNSWTFDASSSFQRKDKILYMQDIKYLFTGFPNQVFGTFYKEFCPSSIKLFFQKMRGGKQKSECVDSE